jgi:DNA invertase Pin-like site-specific DNA recombinase
MTTATQPRAAIYCRAATLGQVDGPAALDAQEAACRAYATGRGYQVAARHVYREIGGAARLTGRPRLDALRAAVRAGEVQAVVAQRPDRLCRDLGGLALLVAECRERGIEVLVVAGPGVPLGEALAAWNPHLAGL